MSEKHYNVNYLQDTGSFLKGLKQSSYHEFTKIGQGTILDLGCGTGMDVANLGKMLPGVQVTGIDHDVQMLDKARELYAGQENISFRHAEVYPLPYEDNSIDGVRAERLIQHLKAPEQVMQDAYRVLQPGAPLVIMETDWASLTFYNEHVNEAQATIRYLTEEKVNNGWAARKLQQYMADCGFREIRVQVFPFVLQSLQDANTYLWIERIIAEAAEKNYFSKAAQEAFVQSLSAADAKGYFACAINMLVVSCVK
jgi:ubiquinone/menaquinone biosynthesis C-methylase UbiE